MTQEERRELRQEWLSKYSVSERLSDLTPSEVLSNISTEKFVAGLSRDQLAMLSKILISDNQAQKK